MRKKKNPPLILASASPRRKQLLEQINLKFEVIPSQVIENFDIDLSPSDFVEYYAKKKALNVAKSHSDYFVIGADTIVVFNGNILFIPIFLQSLIAFFTESTSPEKTICSFELKFAATKVPF